MHMLEEGVEKLPGAANFRNKLCSSVHVLLAEAYKNVIKGHKTQNGYHQFITSGVHSFLP
jgi:hypothetical protein